MWCQNMYVHFLERMHNNSACSTFGHKTSDINDKISEVNKAGLCDNEKHIILSMLLSWNMHLWSNASLRFYDILTKKNSDLQVGIWFCNVVPSHIMVPLRLSCLCLKSHLFWTSVHARCCLHFFHHAKFYFLLRQLIAFPVKVLFKVRSHQ